MNGNDATKPASGIKNPDFDAVEFQTVAVSTKSLLRASIHGVRITAANPSIVVQVPGLNSVSKSRSKDLMDWKVNGFRQLRSFLDVQPAITTKRSVFRK